MTSATWPSSRSRSFNLDKIEIGCAPGDEISLGRTEQAHVGETGEPIESGVPAPAQASPAINRMVQ